MPYLRSLLGVLLVLIALAAAGQSSAAQSFCFADADTSQSDDSDGQSSDQAAPVDGFLIQNRFTLLLPPQTQTASGFVRAATDKPVLADIFQIVLVPAPGRLLISQSGLLPRAPSLV